MTREDFISRIMKELEDNHISYDEFSSIEDPEDELSVDLEMGECCGRALVGFGWLTIFCISAGTDAVEIGVTYLHITVRYERIQDIRFRNRRFWFYLTDGTVIKAGKFERKEEAV